MAKFEHKLTDMLRPAVEEVGKELLGIEYISAGNNSVLRLFIDHENGIDVEVIGHWKNLEVVHHSVN